MRLTEHFELSEFLVSKDHPELLKNVELTDRQICQLYWLCEFALEPLRWEFGPIQIHSGYRTEELNKLVGGVADSLHIHALAADIEALGASNQMDVWDYAAECLNWKGELFYYGARKFTHIALPRPGFKAGQRIFADK